MRALWRFGLWGISAALALAAAAWSAHSDFGTQRLVSAFAVPPAAPETRPPAPTAAQLLARSVDTENETRRLAEAVRMLNADRDRLQTRIRTLERNLEEVIDSIAHARAAALPPLASNSTAVSAVASVSPALPAPPPAPPPPPLASAPPTTPESAWSAAVSRPPAAVLPSPASWPPPSQSASTPATAHELATGSIATRTQFGVDLGGATNFQALRTLWTSIRSKHAGVFDGLRPLVSIRESLRPGEVELRLVAGPLLNAAEAARLCASLTAAGLVCRPALFDGHRLALR
jgi:hypothetical protein